MSDEAAGLYVGFTIDAGGSEAVLDRIQRAIGETEGFAVKAAGGIERSMNGLSFEGATVKVKAFGSAYEREMREAARSSKQVENSAEGMIRSLTRQAETFGKSSSQIRQMRVEATALAAESRGMTEVAARLRAVSAEMDRLEVSSTRSAVAGNKNAFALKQTALQLPDVVGGLLSGQKPSQIFIQQGGQIAQIAQMAEGGVRGFTASLFAASVPFLPLIALLGAAAGGFALLVRYVNDGVGNDQLTRDLGKITGGANATKQELFKLKDETITWGDTMSAVFSVVGGDIRDNFVGEVRGMVGDVEGLLDRLAAYGKATLAGVYAGVVGTKAYIGELSKPMGVVKVLTGDPTLLARTYGKAYDEADKYLTNVGKRVKAEALNIARQRLADNIGYNAPDKPKVDRTSERLTRENEAIEAQIRNLYALADAYGVSGAAALVAEARAKAESAAIRKKGDVEQFVAREVQLSVAQRTADAARSAFAIREQADAQAEVNTMVAEGLIPAERANDVLRDRVAELPILAAIEAAYQVGRVEDARKAEQQLRALRDANVSRDAAGIGDRFVQADAAAEKRLAQLREELRLVGATDAERGRALTTLRATQEAIAMNAKEGSAYLTNYVAKQVQIADLQRQIADSQYLLNDQLGFAAEKWDLLARNAQNAGQGIADAFGEAGRAIGEMATLYAGFHADRERAELERDERIRRANGNEAAIARANALYATATATRQIGLYGDMSKAAKGFFGENTKGYKAMETAEKVFRAVEFALSVRAIAQDAIETGSAIVKSGARAAAHAVEAVAKAIASLPFPANLAAGAATAAALAAIGLPIAGSFGGGKNTLTKANEGTGTVFGDAQAKSESIRRAIDSLKEVDTLMLSTSREMAGYLRSIESQIGGVAALVVRAGNIDANAGVQQGFKANAIGSLLGNVPLIGGFLKSLFGSTTTVIGSGLYGGAQSLSSILGSGFDASYYSDIEKKKKFLGITTGKSYSTQYSGADAGLENQFTLILRGFNDAIRAAAGPLGASTDEIEQRLNGFIVNIGKIDTKGLTGAQIEEKLTAVFGAAADGMAAAAIPGIERFQKVGEGAFETLVRVASTVETVTSALNQMGFAARNLSIDAKLGVADQFDSARDFATAADAYVRAYYTKAEQNATMLERFGSVFVSLGVTIPRSLADFRALVEAQDLASASGQATYATLLKLAPAFADLMSSMEGAKSAADVLAERQDLERKLLELNGDTAAIRALDLAKLDASNRALQQQIWAIQDAQEAARAAEDLRKAWTSVGDSIMDEVKRIRGLDAQTGEGGFATLMGRFNAATLSARAGDQDAAKSLPGLSQELLRAAENASRSRQELDRVRAQTAASLEETFAAIARLGAAKPADASTAALLDAMTSQQASTTAVASAIDTADEIRRLREEVAAMRQDNNAGHAATAGITGRVARKLDDVTPNGDAISVDIAA